MPPRPLILGLTGSIGSGKSFVSSLFGRANAVVICADAVARDIVAPASQALQEIVAHFGPSVLRADGSLDRQALAGMVFSDPAQRHVLESIIHPRVRQRELEIIQDHKEHPLIVIDVPLLYETGFETECDRVLTVLVSDTVRYQRLAESRSMSPAAVDQRLASQMPQREKARRSHFLVDNSAGRPYTCNQVNRILHRLFPAGLPQPLTESTLDPLLPGASAAPPH